MAKNAWSNKFSVILFMNALLGEETFWPWKLQFITLHPKW